ENPIRMLGEGLEQIELHRSERDFLAVGPKQLMRVQIELAASHSHASARRAGLRRALRCTLLAAAQHALEAGAQLARIEGLSDVIVRAPFQNHHTGLPLSRRPPP